MSRGTRRMWSRRILRAGWMVAAVMSWPRRAYMHFLADENGEFSPIQFIVAVIVVGLAMSVKSCTVVVIRANTIASPEQVTDALEGNPCMIEMMPRWLKNQGRPLTVQDLHEGSIACEDAFEAHYAKRGQQKAMDLIGNKK